MAPAGPCGAAGACAPVVTANKAAPSKAAVASTEREVSFKAEKSFRLSLLLSDGTLGDKDATAGQTFRTGDAGVPGHGVPQRPVDRRVGRVDADPGRDQ